MHTITEHYLACALWADLRDENGDSLDQYSIHDIAQETIDAADDECQAFAKLAESEFHDAWEYWNEEQFGHDYWLTRNGHGTGFWDRYSKGRGEVIGDRLAELCRHNGRDIYLGDDEKVYIQ